MSRGNDWALIQAQFAKLLAGKLSQFGSTTSAELASVISDETGSGNLVFNTNPTFLGNIFVGDTSVSTATQTLQLGNGRTGNGFSHLDLIGDTTYPDYGTRLIRNNTGANASSELDHRGTGTLRIITREAAPLEFLTSGNVRMRIDSAGQVTMPAQPLFSASHTLAINVTGVVLNSSNCFNQIDYNIGSNFVAGTGRFTAQVAGYYEASAHFASITANTINVRIRRNGVANTGPLVEIYNQAGTGSTNNYARAIIFLNVGDYIDFEASRLDTLVGIQHKRFLIRLLQ
jgi:hypothetical protein